MKFELIWETNSNNVHTAYFRIFKDFGFKFTIMERFDKTYLLVDHCSNERYQASSIEEGKLKAHVLLSKYIETIITNITGDANGGM